ncbi:MAG: hypothetical protein EXS30_08810 [Pedosphaera sp.]|nr:hypothetical protein [Pedosphaera sp.]
MHLERLFIANARGMDELNWNFRSSPDAIRKWTALPRGAQSRSLMSYITLACAGSRQAPELTKVLPPFAAAGPRPISIEFVTVCQPPHECGPSQPPLRGGGWKILSSGEFLPLSRLEFRNDDPSVRMHKPHLGSTNCGWLFLGYGRRIRGHLNTDAFDFADPQHCLKRFASLFDPEARLTDPLAFLERLHNKGVLFEKGRSLRFITRLNRELSAFLHIQPKAWLEKRHDFRADWQELNPVERTLATVVLDAARHLLEGSVGQADPFEQSGVLVLDGIEAWCPGETIPEFLSLLDSMFPNLQFLVTLSARGRALFPALLSRETLPIPPPPPPPKRTPVPRLPPGAVLLIDVDSQLPNLALMKLSQHFKAQGRRVVLARRESRISRVETVFASCVFAFPQSAKLVERLKRQYGSSLQLGGSGVDIKLRLPPEIEDLPADYSLYPELGDRALGFLTRGCPLHCPFCIVPIKEGKPRIVSDFDTLLAEGRKKLILLDDNILSHPKAVELMEEMLSRDLEVNFNQTLDVRFLTEVTARLLRRIRCSNVRFTRRNYYFSLNNTHALDLVRRRYEMLQVTSRDNVEFVCMYGFDTTLADDVKRFQFLRSLPGAYVFLQRYRPVLGGPEADLSNFFDEDADEQIDALLRVNFTQNMKSMEVYYRWLCRLYAEQCGRVHRGLVETLFRYNARHRMGGFLARLERACQDHVTCHQQPLEISGSVANNFPQFV